MKYFKLDIWAVTAEVLEVWVYLTFIAIAILSLFRFVLKATKYLIDVSSKS